MGEAVNAAASALAGDGDVMLVLAAAVQRPVPILTFAAEPDGAPPPILCAGTTGDLVRRPAGGDPMLVLRRRADVLRALCDGGLFGMAGVTTAGELAGCPLTGAEMQSPDGGLLNMNGPALRKYRQRINGLFTRRAAEAASPALHALARDLSASLRGDRVSDVLARFAEPFTAEAVSGAMGTPREDWDLIQEFSRVAFAVVSSAEAVSGVAAAWEALYDYYGSIVAAKRARPDGALVSQMIDVLDGFTDSQITHVVATVSNGFGAILPVLATALVEVAAQPRLAAACRQGGRSWGWLADHLLSTRSIFPVALPRVALADTWIDGVQVSKGTLVLPSLVAAAHDRGCPPSRTIAFGAGPHFCPGAALTRLWLEAALAEFFGMFPAARLAGRLDWQPGTLSVPQEIPMVLRG